MTYFSLVLGGAYMAYMGRSYGVIGKEDPGMIYGKRFIIRVKE